MESGMPQVVSNKRWILLWCVIEFTFFLVADTGLCSGFRMGIMSI